MHPISAFCFSFLIFWRLPFWATFWFSALVAFEASQNWRGIWNTIALRSVDNNCIPFSLIGKNGWLSFEGFKKLLTNFFEPWSKSIRNSTCTGTRWILKINIMTDEYFRHILKMQVVFFVWKFSYWISKHHIWQLLITFESTLIRLESKSLREKDLFVQTSCAK